MRLWATMAAVLLAAQVATAGEAILEWDAPGGGPAVAGYTIHRGAQSGVYPYSNDVGNVLSTTISNLAPGGVYWITLSSYSTQGVQSVYMEEIRYMHPTTSTTSSTSTSSTSSSTTAPPRPWPPRNPRWRAP